MLQYPGGGPCTTLLSECFKCLNFLWQSSSTAKKKSSDELSSDNEGFPLTQVRTHSDSDQELPNPDGAIEDDWVSVVAKAAQKKSNNGLP